MKVYQGNVLSVNSKNEVFRFLVEDKGKILFVGDELPEEYRCCEIVALGQRALIPTFCDTHQHFAWCTPFPASVSRRILTSTWKPGLPEGCPLVSSFVFSRKNLMRKRP